DDGGYALWSDHGLAGMAFAANGEPRPETRTLIPAPPGTEWAPDDLIAVNGAFYAVWSSSKTSIHIRRTDGTAEKTLPKTARSVRLLWNGSRFLLIEFGGPGSALFLDADLHVISPRLPLGTLDLFYSAAPSKDGFLIVVGARSGMHLWRIDDD